MEKDITTETLSAWERIEIILNDLGITANAFARRIGLKRAETIYQIKRGKNGLSASLAERIASHYPQYVYKWLVTGTGDRFVERVERTDLLSIGCEQRYERRMLRTLTLTLTLTDEQIESLVRQLKGGA